MTSTFNDIIKAYTKVISAFKNRHDVNSGTAIGYRRNQDPNGYLDIKDKPHSIGEGLTTTGWCVSASQALMLDNSFKTLQEYRGAQSKLISIDIKEMYYGKVYNGSPNYWHTALLVKDSGVVFIIDITCAQFGNAFVGKFIWDFETWERTFRRPDDTHVIYDFDNNPLTSYNMTDISGCKNGVNYDSSHNSITDIEAKTTSVKDRLNKISTVDKKDAEVLSHFFLYKLKPFNTKLINGILNPADVRYLESVQDSLDKLDMVDVPKDSSVTYYHVIVFDNKNKQESWLNRFVDNGCVFDHYAICHKNLDNAIEYAKPTFIYQPYPSPESQHIIIMKVCVTTNSDEYLNDLIDTSFMMKDTALICYGQQLVIDEDSIKVAASESDTYQHTELNPDVPTNTIIVTCK